MNDETIMPDGRPLFAWKNTISMQENEIRQMKTAVNDAHIFRELMGLIYERWQDISSSDWHFRVSSVDACLAPDFKENLKKYLEHVNN